MTESRTKTRFAPSPTGMLHVGNLRTALFSWLFSASRDGTFLLRIEDTDQSRSEADYAQAIETDLEWLGLIWHEGPGKRGQHGPYLQSERGDIYRNYFDLLEQQGQAYHCFCSEQQLKLSRKAQLAAGQPPRYAGTCLKLTRDEVVARLAKGMQPTLRFRVPPGATVEFDDLVRGPQRFETGHIGDFVVRRSDGTPAFFFCNAVDDALMGVTHVLRGEDHLTNTPRQVLLLESLGLPVPRYGHIAMIVGADGTPLSKRHGSFSVHELSEAGYLPDAVINYLARLGHNYDDNSFLSTAALAAQFQLERVGRVPSQFDPAQLRYWQREAVIRSDTVALWEWMGEDVRHIVTEARRDAFIDAIRPNVLFPKDALHWATVLFCDPLALHDEARQIISDAGAGFYEQAVQALDAHRDDFAALMRYLKAATNTKGKALFQPLRAALTGETDGPEMAQLIPLLSIERARRRLQAGINSAGS